MTTTVRSVRVELDASISAYVAKMQTAGRETEKAFGGIETRVGALNRSLDGSEKRFASVSRVEDKVTASTGRMSSGLQTADRRLTSLTGNAGRAEAEIDKLSGRLRVVADLAAIGGPGLVPFGAGALGAAAALTAQVGALGGALGVTLLATHGARRRTQGPRRLPGRQDPREPLEGARGDGQARPRRRAFRARPRRRGR